MTYRKVTVAMERDFQRKDPAFRTEEGSLQLTSGLSLPELEKTWNTQEHLPPLKKILRID